ncbi:helix-turn-helix transcriptional regulator [Leeia sp. TBRC 13508]|uniref:Helix-turn-helix transcriptional regulator n=1 Tax=Leeia speluncae TaxID=2884804 RepID=A0ABS8D4R9_9NEIS|nr:helix-turn-helix domain-containing protein [Leeia speluncae]MCB6182628.1 helix-turn-helix transcriptional regulator [Leeia speluncae]
MDSLKVLPCDDGCPVRLTAELVGHKWTTLIVRELISGKKRYSELQRGIPGISPRILAERLKQLEQHQLLKKTIFPTIPPTTEYELTSLGQEMKQLIYAMAAFGQSVQAAGIEVAA